jgi:hypothetical protein
MKRRSRKIRCTCDGTHEVNGHRAGMPVALWTCPIHGRLFEERASEITLTPFQEQVLATVSSEHKAGRLPSVDDLSWLVNRTVASVDRAMSVLKALNFIEGC